MNLAAAFASLSEPWRPRVVAEVNGQAMKVVKAHGEFPWHRHDGEDELFLVWRGRFRVEFRDRVVELGPGDSCVVPRGIEHRTCADDVAEVVIFEPLGVVNTGDAATSAFTAPVDRPL